MGASHWQICMNPNVTWMEVECAYVRLQSVACAFVEGRGRRSRRIRYEDLLREPARTLALVCQLVGREFEDGMEEPYGSADVLASFKPAFLVATTDPKL